MRHYKPVLSELRVRFSLLSYLFCGSGLSVLFINNVGLFLSGLVFEFFERKMLYHEESFYLMDRDSVALFPYLAWVTRVFMSKL